MESLDLIVDPEISACQRKLTNEEFAQLEANILADKEIRDALVVWKGHATIVDGENRYHLHKKHSVPFRNPPIEKEFPDKEAVFAWIDENQTGRRNIEGVQLTMVRARMFARTKDAKKVAELYDVTPRQVYRDQVTAKAIEDMPPELQERLRKGELVASDRGIRKFGELDAASKAKVSEALKKDPAKSLNEVLPAKKPVLSESDREVIKETFSPAVTQKIALGGIKADPKDVKRLEKLDPVSRETVDDILATGGTKDLGEAIDALKPKGKKLPAPVDTEKLRTKIGDGFAQLRRLVDDLGLALKVSVEPVQDALKIAENNLP